MEKIADLGSIVLESLAGILLIGDACGYWGYVAGVVVTYVVYKKAFG